MTPVRPPPLSLSASLRHSIIERHLSEVRPASVVEVGCGIGAMAYRLAGRYDYRGYEPDRVSYERAVERLEVLGRGEVRNAVLPASPDRIFDLLVAFEVLEHIEDDLEALRSWVSWIRPGGSILLSVPAHPERFSHCDQAVGHCRRYTREGLIGVAIEAGIEPVACDAWGMPAGYVLEWIRNQIAARRPQADSATVRTSRSGRMLQPPSWLGGAVEIALRPLALLQRPFARTEHGIGFVLRGRLPA